MRPWRFDSLPGALLWLAACLPAPAVAGVYTAAMDTSRWKVTASPLHCRMEHEIPRFGRAIFQRPSGGELSLDLEAWSKPLKKGKADVTVERPVWKPGNGLPAPVLTRVAVSGGHRSIQLSGSLAERLFAELERGWQPTFARAAWYHGSEEVRVGLSSANFHNGHRDWTACMAQLLPVNFDQIERSVLLYGSDGWRLNARNRARLDLIARYIKADANVARVYVDGHSDSLGRRLHNRELSKQRANVVTAYLIEQGVAEEIITTRYHGERFPVANNRTRKGRERNRRATVRLELADPAANLAGKSLEEAAGGSRFTGPDKLPGE